LAQTLSWAEEAAGLGEYQDALSWIRVLEVVDGELSRQALHLREFCQLKVKERAAEHAARRSAA
jgi:hypothetical protein